MVCQQWEHRAAHTQPSNTETLAQQHKPRTGKYGTQIPETHRKLRMAAHIRNSVFLQKDGKQTGAHEQASLVCAADNKHTPCLKQDGG